LPLLSICSGLEFAVQLRVISLADSICQLRQNSGAMHSRVLSGALRGVSAPPRPQPLRAAGDGYAFPTLQAHMVLDCRCGVGEGLFWDADSQLLRFLDIPGKQLWSYDPVTEATTTADTPERPGTWAKCESAEAGYIVAFESGFALFNPDTGAMTKCDMGDLKIDPANGGRLNDGRCDRQGRLVCGGYNDMLIPGLKQSSCFQVSPDGLKVRKLIDTPIACANSTCFSPDGETMYFCDTPERVIWAFDYDIATGDATNRRDFIDFNARGLDGVPDGSTVDAQGGLWSCNITGECGCSLQLPLLPCSPPLLLPLLPLPLSAAKTCA
jgi:L-arabinonolactonase